MPTYQVKGVEKKKSFEGQGGTIDVYQLVVSGNGEDMIICQKNQKPTTPAPKVGDTLEGTIEDGQYGKKFKADQKSGFGGNGYNKSDPTSFHVSYAKDVVVAFINVGIIKDAKDAASQWTNFATLSKGLYDKLSKGENPIKEDNGLKSQPQYDEHGAREAEIDINEIPDWNEKK